MPAVTCKKKLYQENEKRMHNIFKTKNAVTSAMATLESLDKI